jgi:uncharacterized protein (DUF924 family)
MSLNSQIIIDFWFHELTPKQWWGGNPELDRLIDKRFGKQHKAASMGELWSWRNSAQGALAEIIILDQFSRNIYRGTALAFAADGIALVLAQQAIDRGYDKELELIMRGFLYMPFMHSESAKIQEQSIAFNKAADKDQSLDYALRHKEIIDRFGRLPHRNHILGRISTPEEIEFLKDLSPSF